MDSPDPGRNGPPRRFWQAGRPFVLLDDQRPGGTARLYRDPVGIVEARTLGEVKPCLARLREGKRQAAGFLAYEAGHALERRLEGLGAGEGPLLWFGLFDSFEEGGAAGWLPSGDGAWAGAPCPRIAREAHEAAVETARQHIFAGDFYQANLTFQADVATAGHPLALYAALRERGQGGWGAVVFTGREWLLSFSPELFFTLAGGRITARPMKGTAPAGSDPAALQGDPKQRAENLMIVDLLRNDLSRVSRPGSVEVPALFAVEHYPTVLQMTSTVTAELEAGVGPVDVLEAIFPCGSVTGAPKIRAMEAIAALEPGPRGAYTGSIGRLAPDGEAAFNVAIRTLLLPSGGGGARIGLGSGIVADSVPAGEWFECLAKGAFVETIRPFDLIETMRFDPVDGLPDLDRHLARMKRSADALGFAFDRHGTRNELQAATFFLREPRKLRLRLSRTGAIAIETTPLPPLPAAPVPVEVRAMPVEPEDFRLAHKTSDRSFYDEARGDAFEILFQGRDGFLTEGSWTSLFVERGGRLLTPPLARGLLPGILRERLLEEGRAAESDLGLEDLRGGFYIGNAVRGLIAAELVGDP